MARFKDETVIANALMAHVQPGERLIHFAYGVKQPNIGLVLLLLLLGLLPGLIATALLTREYVIGLTDHRLIVLRFTGKLVVKEAADYSLHQLPPVTTSKGAIFTRISIKHPQRPFVAKFHRAGGNTNREQSQAIADALAHRALAANAA